MRDLKPIPRTEIAAGFAAIRDGLDGGPAVYFTDLDSTGRPKLSQEYQPKVADNILLAIESSGSTGHPKLFHLSASALIASAEATAKRLGGPGQWLLALPINHIAGAQILVRSAMADTEPIWLDPRKSFTPEAFLEAFSRMTYPRKFVSFVPTQLLRLVRAGRENPAVLAALAEFDAVLVGGQRVDWALVQELRIEGVNVVVSYGMTETAGGCVYDGVPLDGVTVTIHSERIEIAGPILADGLQPKFRTSDNGEFVEGKLEVLGRSDRVIISGGLKVALDRVEDVVRGIPGVESCLAGTVLAPDWGERVGLYIQTESGTIDPVPTLDAAIGPEARPMKIIFGTEALQLPNGKPDYQRLNEMLLGYKPRKKENPPEFRLPFDEDDDDDEK